MAKSKKEVRGGVVMYLDGRAVESNAKAIQAEMRKVKKEIDACTIGSDEYVQKTKQYRQLNAILQEHKGKLREVNTQITQNNTAQKNWLQWGISKFNEYSVAILGAAAALTGVTMKLQEFRKKGREKEESQANLKALTGLDDGSIQWLTHKAEELSTTMDETGLRIRQSSREILDAYTLVGSAKPELLNDKEALNGVTVEAIRLANAAKMELKPAADGLTLAMNQYGAAANEASRYTNALAAGSKFGSAGVEDQTEAIVKSGVAASVANVKIENLVGSIETLAERGIKGKIAGTGLKTFFLKLEGMADDVRPSVVGLQQALENLQDKQLSASEMQKMFGLEAYTVAQAMISGAEKVKYYTEAVTGTNTATEQAAINSETSAAKLDQLEKEGLAYEGMLKRKVIEGNYTDSLKTDTIYAIVGFNALSETERRLFLHLKNNCNALFYWDYDEGIDTEESGDCLRENIHLFGEAMPPQQSQDSASCGPDSVLIASSTDNAQCRFAGDWLKDTIKAEAPQNRTAIVLCDESLLLPVLHSIPPVAADGTPVQLNITMGYPMQDMPVSSFILAMLTMQVKGWRDDRTLFYRYVNQVLQHPLVQRLDPDGVKTIMSEMLKYNIVYPHTSKFADSDALSRIFIRKTDTIDILSHLKDCLELIARNIGTDISSTGTANSNGSDPLTAESLFAAWTMVNRLLTIAQTGRLPLQRGDTLIRLMRHIISQRAIPFHGEPACGVQLMGVLETRNLDFDNIIMLSVGEGIMPRPSHQSSFVPYTLRQAYGMTTTELGDGIYAYYFNRLRHRASHVTYVFNNSTEGLHKGEMSRFLINMKLSGIEIKNLRPASDKVIAQSIPSIDDGRTSDAGQTTPCTEQKGADDAQAHSVSLSFSPSALNTYIVCPLKYYLTYPCGLREPDEVSEEINDACFGSIFHRAMELIYKDFVGKGDIQASQIASIRGNKVALEKLVTQAFTDITQNKDTHFTGEQRLNHDVITHFVEKQLELDEQLCPMAILGLERPIELPYGGKGIIDREDIVTIEGSRRHRIVDYKTSAHPNTASSIEALFTQSDKHAGHIFQALYYCEVVTSQNPDGVTQDTLSPALDYVKPYHPGDDMTIRISSEPVTDYHAQCHKEFRQRLDSLIAEIRSDQNQFGPTPSKSCEYCPFITICPSPASN